MDLSSTLRAWLSHEWLVLQKACCRYTNNREKLLRLRYKEKFGHEPDLENPQTLNEKVMWLMLHESDPRWSELADKYRVREYVRDCGLGGMLNELYAVWDSAEEIDLDDPRLPDSFVLKPNNGYGDIVLVRDRKTANRKAILRRMSDSMRHRFGRKSGEWHYRAIKPCVIAERLLPADPAFGSTLVDYKFYCFDGKPRYCQVCYERTTPSHAKKELYDARTWEDLGRYVRHTGDAPVRQRIPRPESLDEMLKAAERLSAGFRMVRVDFYEVEGRPVFGEMTFTPAAGTSMNFTDEFQHILGDCLPLPECRSAQKHGKAAFPSIFNLLFLVFNFEFGIFALL
ncbi:MAG: ATP-grasp fold amidoligase family protein [Alistipes sp.]